MGSSIAAGSGGIGSLLGAYAQFRAGRTQQAIDEYNANIDDLQAAQTIEQGISDAGQTGVQGRRMIGAQRASYGAQGVDVNTGTAADIQHQTSQLTQQQTNALLVNAARTAWGYQSQAAGRRFAGDMAAQSGNLSAYGSLISGAGQSAAALAML